jgi:hypothetical protein
MRDVSRHPNLLKELGKRLVALHSLSGPYEFLRRCGCQTRRRRRVKEDRRVLGYLLNTSLIRDWIPLKSARESNQRSPFPGHPSPIDRCIM